MRLLIPVSILGVCLLIQGCVGVAALNATKEEISNPVINDVASLNAVSAGTAHNVRTNLDYTAQWLEAHWGNPNTITPESGAGGGEIGTYKFGSSWRGVIPMLIVPIPLVLPTGSDRIVLVMRESRAVSAERVGSRFSGAGAGLLGPDGFGAWAGSWKEDPK